MEQVFYPFTEQTNLYEVFSSNTWGGSDGITGSVGAFNGTTPSWWPAAKAEYPDFPKMIASVATYRCPTRRGANMSYHDEAAAEDLPGPLGDYATPILNTSNKFWHNCYRPGISDDHRQFRGPLRVAVHNGTSAGAKLFVPRDDFSYWSDGTSNQLVLGEKHIPLNRLGVSKNGTVAAVQPYIADTTYVVGGRWGLPGCARNILSQAKKLASPGDKEYEGDKYQPVNGHTGGSDTWNSSSGNALNGSYDFGSAHPGVCLFLLGDGSVRNISNTTPTREILAYLVQVDDGKAVTMP